MSTLLSEAEQKAEESTGSREADADLISAAKKIEMFEVREYEQALEVAKALGVEEPVEPLEATINEERHAEERLSELEKSRCND